VIGDKIPILLATREGDNTSFFVVNKKKSVFLRIKKEKHFLAIKYFFLTEIQFS
jgi:hypothetical protein